jgi:hypothetical protein
MRNALVEKKTSAVKTKGILKQETAKYIHRYTYRNPRHARDYSRKQHLGSLVAVYSSQCGRSGGVRDALHVFSCTNVCMCVCV